MNYSETFNDFASRIGPTDIALYAGAALVIYVLFKDKLNPVQKLVGDLLGRLNLLKTSTIASPVVVNRVVNKNTNSFHALIASWKQTRDLALESNCEEAVKAIDQVFPFLSPNSCSKKDKEA